MQEQIKNNVCKDQSYCEDSVDYDLVIVINYIFSVLRCSLISRFYFILDLVSKFQN